MIASLRSMLDAHLDRLTGPDALVWVGVIAGVSMFVGAALVAAWSVYWPRILKRLARWHVRWINRKRKPQVWPIPFVEPQHSDPWPMRVTLAFAALVLAIMFNCGFKGV